MSTDHPRFRVLMEPRHGATYDRMLTMAKAVEAAGFDAFFRSDHLMGVDPGDLGYRPTDSWTTLAGIAREVERVRLGVLVGAATFRQPGILANIVASVDEMSEGRIELGLGTGWYEREHAAFGVPFPARRERFDVLEEELEIITGLWRTEPGDSFSFHGKHFHLDANRTPPRPTQAPHPPIIVGGTGPKRTPAIAARFADEFNGGLSDDLRARFDTFDAACERIGRDPAGARHSAAVPVACGTTASDVERRVEVMGSEFIRTHACAGSPGEVAARLEKLVAAGADTVYFQLFDIDDLDHIALLGAEVLSHWGHSGGRSS